MLKELGVRHFSETFKDDKTSNISDQLKIINLFPSFLSATNSVAFTSLISLREIESTPISFKKDSSPGPDGWPVEFFLGFFKLLGSDLPAAVELSILEGRMEGALNSTFISLIPNKDKPFTFMDFRPISFCNLIYKLIANIASLRLKPFLDKSISLEQFGFLK